MADHDPARDPGFGVYVHWPFCASKCPYCDFNSHVRAGGIDEARFVAALETELAHMAARMPGREVSSIFFGGGTPSLMSAGAIGRLLDRIVALWPVTADAEITLEANPSSVEAERFRGYRTAGVNRVSLGVQALDDVVLKTLGRLHSRAEALAAIETARRTFDRLSFDLIYARPGQTRDAWATELKEALSLAAGHLSLYQLTIEAGTPFAALHQAGKLKVPGDERAHDLFELTQELCDAAGLPAYEISNHARAGQESRHNLLYWRYGEYAGVGPGAHGRLVAGANRIATTTERRPETWAIQVEQQGHGIAEETTVTPAEQADEMLIMGLRIREGVDLARLARLSGLAPTLDALAHLETSGLLQSIGVDGRLRATRAGRFVLNRLVREISESLIEAPSRPHAVAISGSMA